MNDDGSGGLMRLAPQPPLPESVLERARLPLTHLGFAKRVASSFKDDVIYTCELGFGVWDGKRYATGLEAEPEVSERCTRLSDLLREEIEQYAMDLVTPEEIDRALTRELRKRAPAFETEDEAEQAIRAKRRSDFEAAIKVSEQVPTIENVVKALKWLTRVPFCKLDADPYAFHCHNGVLDLAAVIASDPRAYDNDVERRAEWLHPHRRDRYPSRASDVAFDPGAECPAWCRFIELITSEGNSKEDPAMAGYLQRCLGRLLLGLNEPEAAFLFQGEGSNGKSTLMRSIAKVLGSYANHCAIQMFLDTGEERSSASASPDEVRLTGARAYLASEPKHGARLADAKIKQFAGGDPRPSRDLHGKLFEWEPSGHPVLAFNPMPVVTGSDHGTFRRLMFVPFRMKLDALAPELLRRRVDVQAELDHELPGILNWFCDGLADAINGGLRPPQSAQLFKDAMLDDADPVGAFVSANCESAPGHSIELPVFNKAAPIWLEENGHRVLRPSTIKRIMQQRGYALGKIMGTEMWKGLRWRSEHAEVNDLVTRAERARSASR